MASDPTVRTQLVLKGGNALALVHKVGMRASLDFDYSIAGDLEDPDAFGAALENALQQRFNRHDLDVLDFSFHPRPRTAIGKSWGGYNAEFKLVEAWIVRGGGEEASRKTAISIDGDAQGRRTFRIEISKFEFFGEPAEVMIGGDAVCRVYPLDLIAAEKLRSLCQQMPEYELNRTKTPRPRDFDTYADFIIAEVRKLQPLWNVDAP